ncbi:unnamed protein product [Penicillium bialowiezense]
MASDLLHARRPERPVDLIKSLEKPPGEETKALLVIKSNMVSHFKNQPSPMYCKEAMLLSSVADCHEFNALIAGFASAITTGTADEKPLDRDVLHYFAGCLRWGQHAIPPSEQIFGAFLNALSKYLTSSNNESRLRDSYLLTRAIGAVLDAMVDCEVEGLDRVQLHGPLQEKLRGLEDHDEPRMAQAARYALQALHRVPDNEGPWEEAFRYGGLTINIVAQLSGAVAKLDLGQLIDAGPDLLKLFGRFGEALKGGKEIWDTHQDFRELLNGMRGVSEKRGWYDTLRLTNLFLHLEAYEGLKEFISPFKGKPLKCCTKREFWCGLFSQLEQQWFAHVTSRDRIDRFLDWTLELPAMKKLCKECDFTRAWVTLVADSTDRPKWKNALPTKKRGMLSRLRHSKEAQPRLKSIFGGAETRARQPESHGGSPLLQNAMQTCSEAQLFYADALLAQYYTEGKLLHVRRISGDDVPIANCYVNLSLIEDRAERDSKINQIGLSLQERIKAETPQPGKQVNLEDLFAQRKLRDGSLEQPTRILIRGRAGVGKTTLCKKITHAFLHNQLWRSKYDRIIWIPLRNLKKYQTYELFLEQEVFGKIPYSKPLWERLHDKLCDVQYSRSLFLLDGLDEIIGLPENIDRFQYLLNRPDVIITSRPHAVFPSKLKAYDLEIETVGFLDDQIEHYVDMVCSEADGLQIKTFIKQHWMMQGLMRIPIQLDALCFTWEEGTQRVKPLTTMSALYQAIEIKLWKKDIPRLDPTVEHKVAKCQNRLQLALQVPGVIEFIQYIAFVGLYNNITEFGSNLREAIYQQFPEMTDSTLDEVSFLRSTDSSSSPRDQDYYFLHLTFQEYFAARHFLQSWKGRKYIQTWDPHSGNSITISPDDFVASEKYNGRYNIMWRFVAGSMSNKDPDLVRLFERIEMKPRDLFGPVHIRFLVHCFSEVDERKETPNLANFRKNMERNIVRLTNHRFSVNFLREMEIPEQALSQSLEEDKSQQENALEAIKGRSHIGDKLSNQVWDIFHSNTPNVNRALAAAIVGRFPNFCANQVLGIMSYPYEVNTDGFIESLTTHDLSEAILSAVVDFLPRPGHPWNDLNQFRKLVARKPLPQSIINKLVIRCQQTSQNNRSFFLQALGSKECLDIPEFYDIFAQASDDPDPTVRKVAFEAFSDSRCNLPLHDRQKLLSQLPLEPDWENKVLIVDILNSHGILAKESLEHVWPVFEAMPPRSVEHRRRVDRAFQILWGSGLWSIDGLSSRLEKSLHKDAFAICVTDSAFSHELTPPDQLLSHCVSMLERSISVELSSVEVDLLQGALRALMKCGSLSIDIVRVVWQLFKQGKSPNISFNVLDSQHSLPDIFLGELISYSKENDVFESGSLVLLILSARVRFSDSMVESIVFALLRHSDNPNNSKSVNEVLQSLIQQAQLPSWALERLAPLLLSPGWNVARYVRELLRKHADFEHLLPRLEANVWGELFQGFLKDSCEDASIICSIQGHYIHVVLPERSWRVDIEQLEQPAFAKGISE